jgi:hypothetical protein
VLGVSVLPLSVMYLCARGIDIAPFCHIFVCEGYQYCLFLSCICVLVVSILPLSVIYLCVRGIDIASFCHVFVC